MQSKGMTPTTINKYKTLLAFLLFFFIEYSLIIISL